MAKSQNKTVTKKSTRTGIRFQPDPLTVAKVSQSGSPGKFKPEFVCLVVDESFDGCSLVLIAKEAPEKGSTWTVQVGALHPLRAELRWVKTLDRLGGVFRLGFKYIPE